MTALSDLLSEAKEASGLSDRGIARRSEAMGIPISHDTVSTYMKGGNGAPEERTLRALSRVLGIPLSKLRKAAGLPTFADPYQPPPEADRLTRRQRQAVDEIIRAMLEPGDQAAAGVTELRPAPSVEPSQRGKAARTVRQPKRREQVEHLDE